MKAVLNATGYCSSLTPLVLRRPTPLFRVVDKPIIVHVIEFLVSNGFSKIELVLSHLPEMIEDVLEEGSRWGVKITYHLTRDPNKPFAVLSPVSRGWKDHILLLGRADVLPNFDLQKLKSPSHLKATLLYTANGCWTGWGLLPASALGNMHIDAPFDALPESIGEHNRLTTKSSEMEALSFAGWQQSNNELIQRRTSTAAFPSTSRMVEPGIWLSRATTIHPTAIITPPVFIGDNCQILEGASIGPNTVVENHCIIDRQSLVENSIVCQESYVGRSLEIRDSVVDRNTLVNLSLQTSVIIRDDFILAHLAPPPLSQQIFNGVERVTALLIVLVLAPFLLFFTLLWGLKFSKMLQLPIERENDPWPTFHFYTFERPEGRISSRIWRLFQHLPSLINIVRGELHFVGVHPMTALQLERMLPDWQKLYRKTKVGLITLADVDYMGYPSDSERFASETYYAAHQKVRFDIHVLTRWFGRKLFGVFKADSE